MLILYYIYEYEGSTVTQPVSKQHSHPIAGVGERVGWDGAVRQGVELIFTEFGARIESAKAV